MIAKILIFFIIWEVIAIFYYKSKGEEEKAERSINLTIWFVAALMVVSVIGVTLAQSIRLEQGYAY